VQPAPRTEGRWRGWAAPLLLVVAAAVALLVLRPWSAGGSGQRPAAEDAPAVTAAAGATDAVDAGAPVDGSPSVEAEQLVDGPIVPARLTIPAIGVDARVESRGTVSYENPFTGQQVDGYGVPTSMATTSWWSDGPQPGSGQMAVVLGHEDAGNGGAVFDGLIRLHGGDAVSMRAQDGSTLRLQVLGAPVTGLDKATSALADTLNAHPDGADVAFVTCGGEFDQDAGASEDNTVVFASVVR